MRLGSFVVVCKEFIQFFGEFEHRLFAIQVGLWKRKELVLLDMPNISPETSFIAQLIHQIRDIIESAKVSLQRSQDGYKRRFDKNWKVR